MSLPDFGAPSNPKVDKTNKYKFGTRKSEQKTDKDVLLKYKNKIVSAEKRKERRFFATGYLNMTDYEDSSLWNTAKTYLLEMLQYSEEDEIAEAVGVSTNTVKRIIDGSYQDRTPRLLQVVCMIDKEYHKNLPEKVSGIHRR